MSKYSFADLEKARWHMVNLAQAPFDVKREECIAWLDKYDGDYRKAYPKGLGTAFDPNLNERYRNEAQLVGEAFYNHRKRVIAAEEAKDYTEKGSNVGKLVTEKQAQYGDAFTKTAEILKILYPNGIPVDQLKNALTITRVVDKLCRISTNNDPTGENPWQDIAGYAILSL